MIYMIDAKLASNKGTSTFKHPRQLKTLIALVRHCYTRSNGINALCSQIRHQVESVQAGCDTQRLSDTKDYLDKIDMNPGEYVRISHKLNASMRDGTVDSDDTLVVDDIIDESAYPEINDPLETIETDGENNLDGVAIMDDTPEDVLGTFFMGEFSMIVSDD